MIPDQKVLNRNQIRAVFRRHHGTAAQIARELGVHPQNVTNWLKGCSKSARVEAAVRLRAARLIAAEQGEQGAA